MRIPHYFGGFKNENLNLDTWDLKGVDIPEEARIKGSHIKVCWY